jgi:hypothetical protein
MYHRFQHQPLGCDFRLTMETRRISFHCSTLHSICKSAVPSVFPSNSPAGTLWLPASLVACMRISAVYFGSCVGHIIQGNLVRNLLHWWALVLYWHPSSVCLHVWHLQILPENMTTAIWYFSLHLCLLPDARVHNLVLSCMGYKEALCYMLQCSCICF